VDWIDLAQNREKWRAFVYEYDERSGYTGNLTCRGIVGSRRTLRAVTSLSLSSLFV